MKKEGMKQWDYKSNRTNKTDKSIIDNRVAWMATLSCYWASKVPMVVVASWTFATWPGLTLLAIMLSHKNSWPSMSTWKFARTSPTFTSSG